MRDLQTNLHPLMPLVGRNQNRRGRSSRALFECLVLSYADRRGRMLTGAAREGGWQPTWCCNVQNAWELAERRRLQLAIIDMKDTLGVAHAAICQLSERLAGRAGPLTMICGNEKSPDEEIWARQIGAWLYLPGVDEDCDLVALCSEALGIVRRGEEERDQNSNGRHVAAASDAGGQHRGG